MSLIGSSESVSALMEAATQLKLLLTKLGLVIGSEAQNNGRHLDDDIIAFLYKKHQLHNFPN